MFTRFERAYRRRRFDFCPWFFWDEATAAERRAQLDYQAFLRQRHGVVAGARCFLSPAAAIISSEREPLTLGDRCFIAGGAYVTGRVTLGSDSTVNPYATLRGVVSGGAGVRIGAYGCLVGFNHGFDQLDSPIFQQPHTSRGIILGDDVWLGAQVTVIDGVHVGSHVVLGAGAVVTKNVPDYAVSAGNPAKVLRRRNQDL
jgi:acetyltransferase-like isoleucine patch superfamily enzyme